MSEQDLSHPHPVDPDRVARARARIPNGDEAARISSVLTLLADPTRARVVYALDVVEEPCVGDIAMSLDTGEDAVGYALRVLRTAGLVSRRKEGRLAYYRLADGFPEPLRAHCLRRLAEMVEEPPDGEE